MVSGIHSSKRQHEDVLAVGDNFRGLAASLQKALLLDMALLA